MARKPTAPDATQRWPSIERQLDAAKAIHGSKFEEFIRANQETNLLRPGEHNGDGVGVPLWLRVYHRKQHPNEPPAPAGPAGDYPEALNRIQELMQDNQDLLPNPDAWLNVAKGERHDKQRSPFRGVDVDSRALSRADLEKRRRGARRT